MLKSSDSLRQEFIANKDDKSYRHAYADESLNIWIATQIKVLREQRGWRQEDLAKKSEMTQPMISRYENVNYNSWSLNTLKKFAQAYDLWLDVRFRPFGDLVTTTEDFSRESLQAPSFNDDPFFKEQTRVATAGTAGVAQAVGSWQAQTVNYIGESWQVNVGESRQAKTANYIGVMTSPLYSITISGKDVDVTPVAQYLLPPAPPGNFPNIQQVGPNPSETISLMTKAIQQPERRAA